MLTEQTTATSGISPAANSIALRTGENTAQSITSVHSWSTRTQKLTRIGAVLVVAGVAAAIGVIGSLSIGTGWRAYTVHGGSMEPHYTQGDLIVTSSMKASSIKTGQIIVFTADWASDKYEKRVVHRVAAVGSIDDVPIAYTRGDANSIDDPQPVDLSDDNVGVVRFSIPNGAFWLDMLTAPFALAIIFGALVVAIVTLAASRRISPATPQGAQRIESQSPDSQPRRV